MSRQAIQDEFTDLLVSHQRKTQLRWRRDRRCVICGKQLESNEGLRCTKHADAHNARQRKKLGFKPWQQGGVGRPLNKIHYE